MPPTESSRSARIGSPGAGPFSPTASTLGERRNFVELAFHLQQAGKIVVTAGKLRAVAGESLFIDRQCTPEERLGGVEAVGVLINLGEVVEFRGEIGMLGTEPLFLESKRTVEDGLGFGEAPEGLEEECDPVESFVGLGIVGPNPALSFGENLLKQLEALGIATEFVNRLRQPFVRFDPRHGVPIGHQLTGGAEAFLGVRILHRGELGIAGEQPALALLVAEMVGFGDELRALNMIFRGSALEVIGGLREIGSRQTPRARGRNSSRGGRCGPRAAKSAEPLTTADSDRCPLAVAPRSLAGVSQ